MSDYMYNRNQLMIGPGFELSMGLYMNTWRTEGFCSPRMDITLDVKGKRRNEQFERYLEDTLDRETATYFEPALHRVAEMSGNKRRHLIHIILLRNPDEERMLYEQIILASQWDENNRRNVPQYWTDPRYRAYWYFSDIPNPARAFTETVDQDVEEEHAVMRAYTRIMNKFIDFCFETARNIA